MSGIQYKHQYIGLRKRLDLLRLKLVYNDLSESSAIFLKSIDKLAKELDIRFSDERHLQGIQKEIEAFESSFQTVSI